MVTCDKRVLVVECFSHASTVGNSKAVFKYSYTVFVADKPINPIVKRRGRNIWCRTIDMVGLFKSLAPFDKSEDFIEFE